jgi:hypothetical protein
MRGACTGDIANTRGDERHAMLSACDGGVIGAWMACAHNKVRRVDAVHCCKTVWVHVGTVMMVVWHVEVLVHVESCLGACGHCKVVVWHVEVPVHVESCTWRTCVHTMGETVLWLTVMWARCPAMCKARWAWGQCVGCARHAP